MDFIVIEQIRICTEKADFNVSSAYQFFGIFPEEEQGGPLEIAVFGEAQFFQQNGIGVIPKILMHSPAFFRLPAECLQGPGG